MHSASKLKSSVNSLKLHLIIFIFTLHLQLLQQSTQFKEKEVIHTHNLFTHSLEVLIKLRYFSLNMLAFFGFHSFLVYLFIENVLYTRQSSKFKYDFISVKNSYFIELIFYWKELYYSLQLYYYWRKKQLPSMGQISSVLHVTTYLIFKSIP